MKIPGWLQRIVTWFFPKDIRDESAEIPGRIRVPGWPFKGYSEAEFYALPLPEQRKLMGLPFGQNPPAPSFFKRPPGVNVPKGKS